jgi:hypothetical protein
MSIPFAPEFWEIRAGCTLLLFENQIEDATARRIPLSESLSENSIKPELRSFNTTEFSVLVKEIKGSAAFTKNINNNARNNEMFFVKFILYLF